MDDRTQAKTDTPEAIRKKVDVILFKFKQNQSPEKNLPYEEIGGMGEEATVYLAARAPAFDLKSMEGIAAGLINLNKIKASEKVNQVLEGYLSHENPSVRAFAATVLGDQGDAAKAKYLRPLLQDKDVRVRITVLSSLGSVEDRAWFDPIVDLCADPDKDIRTRAYRLARNLAEKHGLNEVLVGKLALNMRSDNSEIRGESADMLGLLAAKGQWKVLADALNDPNNKVRTSAAQALMNMMLPESGEAIVSALERERDKTARIYMAGAAVKLRLLKSVETFITWMNETDAETKKLAEASLQGVTGQNLGSDPAAWSTWWQANKPK
jgi:HEAT repeat protein